MNERYMTINCVIRKNQIEITRDTTAGQDETQWHDADSIEKLSRIIRDGMPDARVTWAFSWQALFDESERYKLIREKVKEFHDERGDDVTFLPGGFFANRYNTRAQVNADITEAIQRIESWTGTRPRSLVAGFLSAANIAHARKEGIIGVQGNIWSQYAIDNQDGDGSICYPYYPSKEHFAKPAQGVDDLIDCVNFDGWTVDFFNARLVGARGARRNSRLGLGPIETLGNLGGPRGLAEMEAVATAHYADSMPFNKFTWLTTAIEVVLLHQVPDLPCFTTFLQWVRERWPDVACPTLAEFAADFRRDFKNNDGIDYELNQRGNGIGASKPGEEITWFMNKQFRLGILKNTRGKHHVFDYTRYTLPFDEPASIGERNWSILGDINQKRLRRQDKPRNLDKWEPWRALQPWLERRGRLEPPP